MYAEVWWISSPSCRLASIRSIGIPSVHPKLLEKKVADKIGPIRAADALARDARSGTSLGLHARAQDRQDAGYHTNLHDRLQPDKVPNSQRYTAVQIFDAEDQVRYNHLISLSPNIIHRTP
jgi:hypothetical protein